jgi:hypothetical protein
MVVQTRRIIGSLARAYLQEIPGTSHITYVSDGSIRAYRRSFHFNCVNQGTPPYTARVCFVIIILQHSKRQSAGCEEGGGGLSAELEFAGDILPNPRKPLI